MNWFLVAHLLALAYLSSIATRFADFQPVQRAWQWFALVPISRFVFMLFRAENSRDPQDLMLVEIWSSGIEALLLGISIHSLSRLRPANAQGKDLPKPHP